MTTGLGDPWFWELRAGAARTLAEEMKDETAKATMLRIAENYDSLAGSCLNDESRTHKNFRAAKCAPEPKRNGLEKLLGVPA